VTVNGPWPATSSKPTTIVAVSEPSWIGSVVASHFGPNRATQIASSKLVLPCPFRPPTTWTWVGAMSTAVMRRYESTESLMTCAIGVPSNVDMWGRYHRLFGVSTRVRYDGPVVRSVTRSDNRSHTAEP